MNVVELSVGSNHFGSLAASGIVRGHKRCRGGFQQANVAILPSDYDVKHVRRLTSEIAAGNPEAFACLYRTRFDHMYAVSRRASGFDENACLDIVQDAMMRVVRYMRPFDDVRVLDNWLTRVTRSVAYDHLRRERRRRLHELGAMQGRSAVVHDETSEILDRVQWVRRELQGLDRAAAEIIELRFHAGLTLSAIGKRLSISTGAVHGRITRTLARLRKRTSEFNDE